MNRIGNPFRLAAIEVVPCPGALHDPGLCLVTPLASRLSRRNAATGQSPGYVPACRDVPWVRMSGEAIATLKGLPKVI